jgi:signal transduction histidine kinase
MTRNETNENVEINLLKIFEQLSEIPLRYQNRDDALRRITELGKEVLRSQVCTLILIDLENRFLTHVACAGQDRKFEELMFSHKFPIDSRNKGDFLDFEALGKQEQMEFYNLQKNGQGIANPKIARRFGLKSLLSNSLKSRGKLIGYLNHFSSETAPFTEKDKKFLSILAHQAIIAFEMFEQGLIEGILHEIRSPLVGIRSNANFLQRRLSDLSEDFINRKLADVITDSELLLYRVEELDYLFKRTPRISSKQRTSFYTDIIIRTVNQLKPLISERGADSSQIEVNPADSSQLILYVNKAKLNQAVFSLLTNSIRYSEKDPSQFKIRIEVSESKEEFIVKFKDWGIGIQKGFEEKIFEQGFRSSEAVKKVVTGSGLGLTIARRVLREIGGDLRLVNNFKPTEFHMILPKTLRESEK